MKLTNRHTFLLRAACALTAGSLLAGCDTLNEWFASDKINYQNAEPGPALSVPADLTQEKTKRHFVMPADPTSLGDQTAKRVATEQQQLQHRLHVEYDGNAYWLVATDYSAEKLWPQLQAMWEKSGFTLATDQPSLGIMETNWTENRARIPHSGFRKSIGKFIENLYSSGTRDKFLTLVQRDANEVAISITHHGMEEVVIGRKDSTRWQDRAREPNLEIAFLTRLMENLGLSETQAQNLINQAQQTTRATVTVNQQENATLIALDEPFERVWWRVGLALDRMNFAVEQRDKGRGLYAGRLIEKMSTKTAAEESEAQKKPGLLKRIFSHSGQISSKSAIYLIRVQSVNNEKNNAKTQVAVVTANGQINNTPAARRLILALHAELN